MTKKNQNNRKNEQQRPPVASIAIVGRPNVGKSALFNRLAQRRISIVHDQAGVTRDRISAVCTVANIPYELIDTGGIGSTINDNFDDAVRTEADLAIDTANIILLVVDGQTGPSPVDQELAAVLRKAGKPVALVVNKIDDPKHEINEAEFSKLGFDHVIGISAAHGRNFDELSSYIAETLAPYADIHSEVTADTGYTAKQRNPRIAIVGRPNVGKSSLVNSLLRSPRTIVSDISGTTRDSVDIPFERGDRSYTLIDTAGIRAKGRHRTSVEVFSVVRSEKSIKRADLCILVIDASDKVTTQDKKIAGLIQKSGKPCIIALNKWDLVKEDHDDKDSKQQLRQLILGELFFLDYAPIVFLSAKSGEYISKLFDVVERIREGARRRITTGQLNRILHGILEQNPPPLKNKRRFKIFYATQVENTSIIPVPIFKFFVNDEKLMPDPYLRFLNNKVRDVLPYEGLPLLIDLKEREQRNKPSGKIRK